jgi:zinc protease
MPKHIKYILLFQLLIVLSSLSFSQKYGITTHVLDNGLEVIVVENHSVPLVTVELDVKNGSYTESPEYDGLSHLYEHMFFKANAKIPSQEAYMERLRELGATFNGTTSEERVNYFITFPKDSLEQGLVFMYDAATSPLFLEQELINERPVVTGEYDRGEANPFFHLNRAVSEKVWWKYYSRKNVIGDREVILTTTPEKMQIIQNRFYVPNNSALLLAGDITSEEGFALAEKIFSDWERAPNPFDEYKVPEHPPIQEIEVVVVEKPVSAVTMMYEWQGPSVGKDPKSTYAADVLSFILGQQTSKFQKDLVESGLALGVNFGYYTLNHTGPITLFAQTTPEKFDACQKALFEELEKMTDPNYFTDEQLENAKTILATNEQYARETASQFVHTVGFWWAVAGLDYYLNYIENLNKVTREDIKNYLETYVVNKNYVLGVLTSPENAEKVSLTLNIKKGELKNDIEK